MFTALKATLQKQVCPYCFEPYSLVATPFRCSSPPTVCAREVDSVFSATWKDAMPIGRVIPRQGFARSVRCPTCRHDTSKRLCPTCHMQLPRSTGDCDSLIFAVIGARAAGKSHYLAALIETFKSRLGPALDVLLEPVDDRTIQRYRDEFYTPVYLHQTTIKMTPTALIDNRVQLPLVYQLSLRERGLFGGPKIVKSVLLVFFDTAGEDLDSQDVMSTVNKYIYRADGIILLLDPLQLGAVRDQLSGALRPEQMPEQNTETSDIITRTTHLILAGRQLPADSTVPTPIAVAFSKFDAVQPLVDPQFQVNATANHVRGFDEADFDAVNGEMQSLLAQWDGAHILQQVRTRYPRHGFFGLSALGCNPHGNNRIPRVLSRRVEDPFLWLLRQHDFIKPVRRS